MSEDKPGDVLPPIPKWVPGPGERPDLAYCHGQLRAWMERFYKGDEMLDHEFGRVMYYLDKVDMRWAQKAEIQWAAFEHLKAARKKTALKWVAKLRDEMFCHALPVDRPHTYVEAFIHPYLTLAEDGLTDLGVTPRELSIFTFLRGGMPRRAAVKESFRLMRSEADKILDEILGRAPDPDSD